MELYFNDRSIHEQFRSVTEFREAFRMLRKMRNVAGHYKREIYCHRAFISTKPIPHTPISEILGGLHIDERRAAMTWISRGPFWDDSQYHSEDHYLECRNDVVTDSAIGEAAFRNLKGTSCGLISIAPSDWNVPNVEVKLRQSDDGLNDQSIILNNWWTADDLKQALDALTSPLRSWDDLREISNQRLQNLFFSRDCFNPLLDGVPFSQSSANKFLELLTILNQFKCAFDAGGALTNEGFKLRENYFIGRRASFSDSSDTEKRKFRQEMTFPHPEYPGESLFCTWHGKVSRLTLRLHFSWPIVANRPLYVVYAGPKITKK